MVVHRAEDVDPLIPVDMDDSPLLPSPTAAACCTPTAHPPSIDAPSPLVGSYVTVAHTKPVGELDPNPQHLQLPMSFTERVRPLLRQFECYVALPQGSEPARGIILVVHDIFGLRTGRHASICDELSRNGFVAACPDLFGDDAARATALNPGWPIMTLSNICHIIRRIRWMKKALKLPWEETAPMLRATLAHCVSVHGRPLTSCGAVGFCWGASAVARLLSDSEAATLPLQIVGGIGFHPSLRGAEGKTLVANVNRPLLLAPAGDDPAAVQPGGELGQSLIGRFGASSVVCFPEMRHGWMTRGPLSDSAIARDYSLGMKLLVEWFGPYPALAVMPGVEM